MDVIGCRGLLMEHILEVSRLLVVAKRGWGCLNLNLVATPGTGVGVLRDGGFDFGDGGHARRMRLGEVDGGCKGLLDGAEVGIECWRRDYWGREVEGIGGSGIGDWCIGNVDSDISDVLTEVVCSHHVLLEFRVDAKEFFFSDEALFVDGNFDGLGFARDGSCRTGGENQLGNVFEVVLHIREVGFEVCFDDGKAIIRFGAVLVVGLLEGSDEIGDVVAGIGGIIMFRGDRRGRRVVDVTGDCFSVGTAS